MGRRSEKSSSRGFFEGLFSRLRSGPSPSLLDRFSALATNTLPEINDLLGLDYAGEVTFKLAETEENPIAATSGNVVTVNPKWFREHPSDDGAIVHELVHVAMHCPRMDSSNWWMIEGIADYVRDKLGYMEAWSSPRRGDPKAGYQATAHFLLFVEKKYGEGYIKKIATTLSESGDLPEDMESKLAAYQAS